MSDKVLFDLPPEVESVDMVVIYDSETGAIRHTHRVFTWKGGEHPSPEELERDAMEGAARDHPDLGNVEMLRVDPTTIEPDALLSVDVEARAIVSTPLEQVRRDS